MDTPSPHPEVNAFIEALLPRVQHILAGQFVGLYFYGSLAYGDFTPGRSDIDFMVLTDGELTPAKVEALKNMHTELASSGHPPGIHVEGVYLPLVELRRHRTDGPAVPTLNADGSFYQAPLGIDWVFQRHLLRQHGEPILGPSIRNRIDPVSPEELQAAARQLLTSWWVSRLEQPESIRTAEYQGYTVLTMCRALHTFSTGEVASKGAAAAWALEQVDERWHPLIKEAAAWRSGMPFDHLADVLDFIRFALKQAGIGSS